MSEAVEESGFVQELQEAIDELDRSGGPISEDDVNAAMRPLKGMCPPTVREREWLWEGMAFLFVDRAMDEKTGTYCLSPWWRGVDGAGNPVEDPDGRRVTSKTVEYWQGRARAVRNPILVNRYAMLAWEFGKGLKSVRPCREVALLAIDSALELSASEGHAHKAAVVAKLSGALKVACELKDMERAARVCDALIMLDESILDDSEDGRWGFSYDLLLGRKVSLPVVNQEEEGRIIGLLERRLARLSDTSDTRSMDPWAAEAAAMRLARHYSRRGEQEHAKRVILRYGRCLEHLAAQAAATLAVGWLERVQKAYLQYGLKDEAGRLAKEIERRGIDIPAEMATVSVPFEVTNQELDQVAEELTGGSQDQAIRHIAAQFCPSRAEAEAMLDHLRETSPLLSMMGRKLTDGSGRTIASVEGADDDRQSAIVEQIARDMEFTAIYLRRTLARFCQRYNLTADGLVDLIARSSLFQPSRRRILVRGLDAYLSSDWIAAVHILVPQMESAVRRLVQSAGGVVTRPNRLGGSDLRPMDDLLRDEHVEAVLGPDVALYLRCLFTDRRGWNVRNAVCHGTCEADAFTSSVADRVLHAVLVLSLVPEQSTSEPGRMPEARTPIRSDAG